MPSSVDNSPPINLSDTPLNRRKMVLQRTSLDPWLGLKARIFLSLFPYGLVALLFVGTRLLISASQVDANIQRSNSTIWNACRETEQAVTSLVSFPHLLADNFNSATKRSVDDTVRGLGVVLKLSITAVESLLVFLVDMYRSMLLCFIQFVVQASIALLISALSMFSNAVHDIAQSIQATVNASVDGINAALSTTLTGFNDILSIIGESIKVPTVPYPNLTALNNVTIPTTLQDNLVQLNDSLPTLAELRDKVNSIIEIPFESLKTQVNSTIANYSFNQSALPVPQTQTITYCNESLDTQPLADLSHDLRKAANVGIGLLVLLALLFLAFNVIRELYCWHTLKKHIASTREAYLLSQGEEKETNLLGERSLFSLIQLSSHPLLAEWGLNLARKAGIRSKKGLTQTRWWLAWISHPIGIVLLVMGLVGLISVRMQIAAVNKIGQHYQGRFQGMLDNSTNGMQEKVDSMLQGMSLDYANKSNSILQQSQDELNNHLFSWVNVTTSTMNDTLNVFMDGIATAINSTFSSTPLYQPVQSFIDCIIGQKVKGIEDGLTWMQSNAHVTFPIVPDDVLMVNPNTTKDVIQPLADSTVGSNGILSDVIGSYTRSLEKEQVMFVVLLLLYLLLVILGTVIAITQNGDLPEDSVQVEDKGDRRNRSASMESLLAHQGIPHAFFDLGDSPAIVGSHNSISKPLHPDIASIYSRQQHPYSYSTDEKQRNLEPPSASDISVKRQSNVPPPRFFGFQDDAKEVKLDRRSNIFPHGTGQAF